MERAIKAQHAVRLGDDAEPRQGLAGMGETQLGGAYGVTWRGPSRGRRSEAVCEVGGDGRHGRHGMSLVPSEPTTTR